jgi:lipopolysaccharide/colanic/teichoic acid biosynthesis glycosyltransferase
MISKPEEFLKRSCDIVGSGLGIVVLSPVILVTMLAVKLSSPGPVFYKQKRLGKDGVPYEIFKLRTMMDKAPDLKNADGSMLTTASDPRVTKVGKFLRRTSLDEIPQLFNALIGNMSLVGPRPDRADQLSLYDPGEERKLLMKPGITGLAMVRGRNSIPWKRRVAIDIEYIENYSLWLDAKIFFTTVPIVLLGRGVNAPPEETKSP